MLMIEKTEIMCLQETHLPDKDVRYLKEIFHCSVWHSGATIHSRGVMIDISKRISWVCLQAIIDVAGRYINS